MSSFHKQHQFRVSIPCSYWLKRDTWNAIKVIYYRVGYWWVFEKGVFWDYLQLNYSIWVLSFISVKCSDEIRLDFFNHQQNLVQIIEKINNRKTGINGKNIIISARIYPPTPNQSQWESFFSKQVIDQFDRTSVGYRPDTILLSNLPVKWFNLENLTSIPSDHEFFPFFNQFGTVSYFVISEQPNVLGRWRYFNVLRFLPLLALCLLPTQAFAIVLKQYAVDFFPKWMWRKSTLWKYLSISCIISAISQNDSESTWFIKGAFVEWKSWKTHMQKQNVERNKRRKKSKGWRPRRKWVNTSFFQW